MIDTHCHLWFQHYKGEVPQVIQRAQDEGVHTLICVGCNEESSKQSVEIAGQYENVYATIGVHPTDSHLWRGEDTLHFFRELLSESKKIVGIGETGIDVYHQPYDLELQKEMFRAQCLLASEFDLPVVVHLRSGQHAKKASTELSEAEKTCLQILDETGMKPRKALFHCFSSDRGMAQEVLRRGYSISFSGVITFPKAEELRAVALECPLDRMVVETDSPFLAPQSKRGGRNEPAFVIETAKSIADLKNISLQEFEEQTDENVRKLFLLQ